MMALPSSPPRRRDRAPYSPTKSEYSIDLAGPEGDGSETEETPLPQQHIDRVMSEEIGGPSDFTMNLEAWMRGNTIKKHQKPAMKDVGVGEGMLTPRKDEDEEKTGSHHTPSATPPKESVFDARKAEDEIGDMSSEWDPYAEAATPHAPRGSYQANYQQHLLQPTVEDYHSELTPARLPSMHFSKNRGRISTIQETSPEKSPSSTPGRPSSETISPVRSPELQRSRPTSSHTQQRSLEQELQFLRDKCQKLELLNASLSKAVEEERRVRNDEAATHETEMKDAARREKDLTNMKDEACKHKEDFRREFSDMKERLQTFEKQHSEGRDGIERLKRDYEDEIRRLRDDGEQETAELSQEIRALEQDLELARKGREDAEDDAKALRVELEEYRDEPDAELDRMRRSLRDDDGVQERVAELEDELRNVKADNEKLKSAKETVEERAGNVRTEMSVLRQTHDGETARLTTDHRRAVGLAEDLQVKMKDMRRQIQEQQARHEAELESINAKTSNTDNGESEVQRLRSELDSKQTALNEAIFERDAARDSQEAQGSKQQQQSDQAALNDAILERDATQDSLQTTQKDLEAANAELAELRSELSDSQVMSSAVDVRISDAIRKREAYWRQRVESMETERRFMAKALMKMWGREEVGVEGPQRYAYMFAEKDLAA